MRAPTFKLIENPTVKDLRGDRRYLLHSFGRYETARFVINGNLKVCWDSGGISYMSPDKLWPYVHEIDDGLRCWDIEYDVLMDEFESEGETHNRVVVETVRKRVWTESAPDFEDPYRNLLSVVSVTSSELPTL